MAGREKASSFRRRLPRGTVLFAVLVIDFAARHHGVRGLKFDRGGGVCADVLDVVDDAEEASEGVGGGEVVSLGLRPARKGIRSRTSSECAWRRA